MSYNLTNRFKVPLIEENYVGWTDLINFRATLAEVMYTTLANKDYVISGLSITTSATALSFSYTGGSVSLNGSTVSVSSGSGTFAPSTYNWVYIQGGQVKVSTAVPSGASYIPLFAVEVSSSGTTAVADLRTSSPTLNGISIAPRQLSPSDNVFIASGKKIYHTDETVGANTIMLPNDEVVEVVTWGNQTVAKDWTERNLSSIVPSTVKFVIVNCCMATHGVTSDGYAVLELKSKLTDTDNEYNVVDYGHYPASTLNSGQRGNTSQFILPLDLSDGELKFQARTVVSNLGTGSYYAFVKLMGYII